METREVTDQKIEIPMGILPDWAIREYVKIEPFAEGVKRTNTISYGLSSFGYDVRLGRRFKVFSHVHGVIVVDPKAIDKRMYHEVEGDFCIIPPNSFALAESLEKFDIPRDVLAICLGKSTYARCGLVANVTPLEPEWCGTITIEISNTTPLPAKVYAGEGIIQVLFFRAQQECRVSYADKAGKYQAQDGLTLPKVD